MYPNYQSFSCLHLSNWTLPEKKNYWAGPTGSIFSSWPQTSNKHSTLRSLFFHLAFSFQLTLLCLLSKLLHQNPPIKVKNSFPVSKFSAWLGEWWWRRWKESTCYKTSHRDEIYIMVTVVSNTILNIWKLLGEYIFKVLILRKKFFC